MVVKASDLSYGSNAEAIFISNIGAIKLGDTPISTTSANALYITAMKEFENKPNMTSEEAVSLVQGLKDAYIFGAYNDDISQLTKTDSKGKARYYAGELTQEQRNYAYQRGEEDSVSKVDAKQKAIDSKVEQAKKKGTIQGKKGKIIFEDGQVVDETALSDVQKANLNGLKMLAELSPINFHVFKSTKINGKFTYTMKDGSVTSANGWYVSGTNDIYIDLNAGQMGEGTMLWTAAHEISHYIREWSPKKWKAMADFIMQEFSKQKDVSIESMLNKQIAKIKRRPDAKSKSASQIRDEAYEELVSDALSEMLVDGSVVNVLAEIKQKDKKLWQKIKEAVQDLLKRWGEILGVYEGRTLESEEANVLKGMEDTFKKLQEMFADAFADANATFESIGETKNTTTEGDVKLQARELQRKDPTKLKEEELTSLLEYTKDKILSDDTYIPVRINTPQILIAFAKEFGYTLENHPLAMQVYKARQALSNEENWDGDYRDKPHDLSLEEMIGIIRAMNNPSHLVFQTENERFAEIVKFEKEGSKAKAYAIVDFSDVNKNPDLMNGYKGGKYNILVTVYPSENSTDLKKYLSNKNHKVLTIEQMKKKGISQGSYGGNTPSLLNDSPFFVDSISQTSQKSQIKLSDRDSLEQRHKELQNEYNSLNKEIEEIKNSEKYKYFVDTLATLKKGEELDELAKEYGRWTHETGLYAKSKRMSEIIGEQKEIRASIEDDRKMSRDAYMKSIESLTEKEKIDFVNKAVERYGTTNNIKRASYLMLNGEMLDFSEGQRERVQDHREISEILDMPDSAEYSDGLIAFMNMGNIRLQTYGIDISQAPNQEQKLALRGIISQIMRESDSFSIDFSKANGYTDGSVEYPKGTSTSKILADIDSYFKTGVVPEYESTFGEFLYSERDFPIDTKVEATVKKAYINPKGKMHELSNITSEQNKAINRLVNQTNNDLYRGKYEGGKHWFSDKAIRHIISEHGDFLREGLRAQLPMTLTDIARHLSATKANKKPRDIKATRTRRGNPSIVTSYEVNGYTLYAEEIKKPLGKNLPNDLIGHTMYKAPTLATAAFYTTSVQTQPKRQSMVLCKYNTQNNTNLSRANFVADENGLPALLNYIVQNGSAKQDARTSGLIALSSDSSNFTDKSKSIGQGYVMCKKPFYITHDNRVFSNSETNVAEKINELKKQGYDCFIFDKTVGDNYMVAVVNKAQIIKDEPAVLLSERDTSSSTRSILANALESVAQNDIEKNKLTEYKEKISQIEAEEKRLSEIQNKLFTKDGVEPSKRRELQFEAKQIANRINTYDRQLLRLEATKPLQNVLNREKALAMKRQKQKDNEYLKQYKEKVAKTTRELITRNQESRKKAVESRNKTAMRHKIKGLKQKLERMLQNPTDHLYVPQGLAEAIIDVCTLVNTDTSLYLKNGEINKAQLKREQTKEKLQALKDEYEKLRGHSDPMYSGEFDDVIYEMLTKLRAKYGEKNLSEMSLDELRYLYNEILKPIEETLADARKLIGKGDAADVYEAGYSIIKEQEEITKKRKNGKRNGVAKTKDDMINLSLSPVRNIERMSGYLFNISVLILQKHK